MTSITICSVPRTNESIPNAALGTLKSSLNAKNLTCHTIDTNVELYAHLKDDYHEAYKVLDQYFQADLRYITQENFNIDEFLYKRFELPQEILDVYTKFILSHAKKIINYNTEWVGISLLSVNSVVACVDLCQVLTDCKIVLGGPGVSTFGIMGKANFGQFMVDNNLADGYIPGEGEDALVTLLQTGKFDHSLKQINDLNALPIPDYSDLNFDLYSSKKRTLYITGSRGCVRNCTFCDIRSAWKKFTFRSGANVANEIITQYKKHQCTEFYFTDSLINGNLKTFSDLLDALIKAKEHNILPENLNWVGQFICRPKAQFKEDWYKRMKLAGLKQLHIGIESGSEDVLRNMGKKLAMSDIDFTMEMLLKYKIQCDMLMIVGYPTEHERDFQLTVDMIHRYKKYNDAGVISGINLGKTMVILPGSPIEQNKMQWGIDYDDDNNWVSIQNPSLTFSERIRRRIYLHKLCQDIGYVIRWPITTLTTLQQTMNKNKVTA